MPSLYTIQLGILLFIKPIEPDAPFCARTNLLQGGELARFFTQFLWRLRFCVSLILAFPCHTHPFCMLKRRLMLLGRSAWLLGSERGAVLACSLSATAILFSWSFRAAALVGSYAVSRFCIFSHPNTSPI